MIFRHRDIHPTEAGSLLQPFERVTDPSDLEAVFELESLTNPRLRDEVGDVRLVPTDDRISGPGTSVTIAAFTHPNPECRRFTDDTHGVFYAANDLETAIAETKYHRERFMPATAQPCMELDIRVYLVDLAGDLHYLRGKKRAYPLVYHNDDYSAGQNLAKTRRKDGSNGIVYHSVRRKDGECAAVFRPRLLSNGRQERHPCYVWDGERIAAGYEKKPLEW